LNHVCAKKNALKEIQAHIKPKFDHHPHFSISLKTNRKQPLEKGIDHLQPLSLSLSLLILLIFAA
jgi:hypothetical protein